jgi:signal peptidase
MFVAIAIFLAFTVLPIPGNVKIFTVMSGSMEPALKVGSVVVVAPASEYKIGDIISFTANDNKKISVTHRIQQIKTDIDFNTYYVVKGDANESFDSAPVYGKMIIGRVIFSVSFLGFILAWIQKPMIFFAIVLIPAAIIVCREIKKILIQINLLKSNRKP